MGQKKTPLIQKLRSTGGTLYVFPSAAEDIGLNLQSTTTGVAMSHYALLNIPEIAIENCFKTNESHKSSFETITDPNQALVISLQDYAMNFETVLLNRSEYNHQMLATVSERVFWHWAQHIGIIDASNFSKLNNSNIYYESGYNNDSEIADNTVIKCFGSIDAGNALSSEFGMYNETYINIPTSWGSGPVYLQSYEDSNYKLGSDYTASDGTDDHLEGRSDNISYYSYTNGCDYPLFDIDDQKGFNYVYRTNKEFDALTLVKNINEIQSYSRKRFNNDAIILSSYDDINIDRENYFGIDNEFAFNAILLYYSVYDQDDLVKTAYATNLFGIIFLDGAKLNSINSSAFTIQTLTKKKSTTSQFGNSFSFRVNLKTMSVYDNTDAIIQDNTTTSAIDAVEFSDAISNMNSAIDIMNANLQTTIAIQNQYAAIMSYYDQFDDTVKDLSTNIMAYLNGQRSSRIDTSLLYVNKIINNDNENNIIEIAARTDKVDDNGEYTYNTQVTIDESGVQITNNASINTVKSINDYIIINNTSINDVHIFNDEDYKYSDRCYNAVQTMNRAFDSSNDLIVKVKVGSDEINHLYVDAASPIFTNNEPTTSLGFMLDDDSNINYREFIPYLIAKVQKLSIEVAELKKNINVNQELVSTIESMQTTLSSMI